MRWKRKHHKGRMIEAVDAIAAADLVYKGAHWQRKAAFNRIDGRMRKKMGIKWRDVRHCRIYRFA